MRTPLVFLFFLATAATFAEDTISIPNLRCETELSLFVTYEPTAGPNGTYHKIKAPLLEWSRNGELLGEEARLVDKRIVEDGSRRVIRATTILTTGDFSVDLPKMFLDNIIRYTVEDPNTENVFILWEPGMKTGRRKIVIPRKCH